jgi:hypothetical protein
MPPGAITLDQVAARTSVLAVSCTRCERAGRYAVATLIARYGTEFGLSELLRRLSEDCTKRASLTVYDLCGVNCPDLAALFLAHPVDLPTFGL